MKSQCCKSRLFSKPSGQWEADPSPKAKKGDKRQAIERRCFRCGRVIVPHDPADETTFHYLLSGVL